jgi:1-acyl-sn-glycerol-3-phosphate acyltransferase
LAFGVWPIPIYYMAKQELFLLKPLKILLLKVNAFPVNRDNPGPSSLKIPLKLLRDGKVVGIFPTGTRNDEQTALKRGAVTIAMKANVPILPAIYQGPKTVKELLRRKKVMVRFGDMIVFDKNEKADKNLLEVKSKELQLVFNKMENSEN